MSSPARKKQCLSAPRQRVHIIDALQGSREGRFYYPSAVCWTADQNLVVCDNGNNRFHVFSPYLTFLRIFGKRGKGEGEFKSPNAVCAGKKKEHQHLLFISDTLNNRIQVTTVEGEFIRAFRCAGPRGICVDGGGNVYVVSWVDFDRDGAEFKIRVFDVQGKELRSFGGKDDHHGQLQEPGRLCFSDEHNQLFVTDGRNNRICVLSDQGKFIHAFGSRGKGTLQFEYPSGICLGNYGVLLVSDYFNHRIAAYQWDGEEETLLGAVGKRGERPGEFDCPRESCMSSDNRLAVVEHNRLHRVQVFDGVGFSSRLPFLCCVLLSQQPFETE